LGRLTTYLGARETLGVAALVEARRPQLLELVRQATDKEFATLVEQELRRLAAHQAAAHGRA